MVLHNLSREELNTDIGRVLYDYSPIKKNVLPLHILKEIAEAFFKRNNITYYHLVLLEDLYVYVALGDPELVLYTEWRRSFYEHGYAAPVLHLTERKNN